MSLVVKGFLPDSPPSFAFDEQFYLFTGSQLLSGDRRTYDFSQSWQTPDGPLARYHPPLGSILASLGKCCWRWPFDLKPTRYYHSFRLEAKPKSLTYRINLVHLVLLRSIPPASVLGVKAQWGFQGGFPFGQTGGQNPQSEGCQGAKRPPRGKPLGNERAERASLFLARGSVWVGLSCLAMVFS